MDVRYSKAAQQALVRSNKRRIILDKIALLASDPAALENNVTRLKGRTESRLRVQDWRVIFVIEGDTLMVRDIAPRSSAYEDET